jgi:hypothetical protein
LAEQFARRKWKPNERLHLAKPLVPPLLSHGPHQSSLHVNPALGSQKAFVDLPCIRVGTDSDGYAWLEVEDNMLFGFVDDFPTA